ncbi:helix-turn-helix domain-containing protein [Bacillus megaterium]|uniref:IclR family transcriptional regulator n=1 Tax=Priestia megaterium TaxID=1404 RepID=UPI00129398FD|nr:IclR family transcriptional regulator [Priestia megaterium]MQR84570.1 helix-turn-helix domain-containing protein [Priestia megaterium]
MSEVGTLKKGLDIFSLLLNRPNMTIPEMMEALGFNKSTMYRLVSTLEQNGFIVRNPSNRYTVSPQLVLALVQNTMHTNYEMNWLSVPAMQKLSEETKETIYAGILHHKQMVTTQVVNGQYSTRTHSEVGNKKPLHANAIGKCILAYQEDSVQKSILHELSLEAYTDRTITELDELEADLALSKERGYAVDDEEREPGVRCIAAPIFRKGKIMAAIALSGPSFRISQEKDVEHAALVKQCAEQISQAITLYE